MHARLVFTKESLMLSYNYDFAGYINIVNLDNCRPCLRRASVRIVVYSFQTLGVMRCSKRYYYATYELKVPLVGCLYSAT